MLHLFCHCNQSAFLRVSVVCLATSIQISALDNLIAASDPAQQEGAEPASKIEEGINTPLDIDWPPTEPDRLLQHLKQRDAAFENRSLQVIERSTERIDPRAMLAEQKFNDLRFGQRDVKYPSPEDLPDAWDQPHRVRKLLIVRGSEVTLKIIGDLEDRINPNYGSLENAGFIWSSVGGTERSYSPTTKSLHLMGAPMATGVLRMYQNAIEWCTGHGFAKYMTSIDAIEVKDDRIIAKGTAQLLVGDKSSVELELDRDLIVRHAVVSIPSMPSGSNEYRVETWGVVRPENAPAVAEHGKSVRVLKPEGQPEQEYTKYDIAFVSLSQDLSDEAYAEATRIEPPEGTQEIDMRPRKLPAAQPK